MATKSLFVKYKTELDKAGIRERTTESRNWFTAKLRNIRRIDETKLMNDPVLLRKNRFYPGYMYHFIYDPKTKDKLPYYDTFPLILAVEPAPNGFYGLNLHYLHPLTRAAFLDKLMSIANKPEFDDKTRLRLTYSLLSSVRRYREFKPCFKHYLTEHIQSRLVLVPASEWEIAIFLPTERFEGSTRSQVWRESKLKYTNP